MFAHRNNLRFAVRQLVKSPGFSLVTVLILTLGIGANTAIFSLVHALLIEPLPYPEANRLVQLWHVPPAAQFPGMTQFALSAANFLDWQKDNKVFEGMTLYTPGSFELSGKGAPESIMGTRVSSGFFQVLGVQPLYGRTFTPEEDRAGKNQEVVLSYRFWKERYGSDPNVIGKTLTLDGAAYVIVGVMGPQMRKPDYAQIWTPLGLTPEEARTRGEHHYLAFARLKPGVSIAQAQAALDVISQRLAKLYPEDDKGWGALVESMRDSLVGDVRPALLMLLGAVGFVLLIACANVANLLFGRAFARRKEIAIRSALGASRANVTQLLLMESVLVALAGGALGLVTAHFSIDLLVKFLGDKLPQTGEVGLSIPVVLFAFALSIVTGLLSGLLPALSLTRGDLVESLKQGWSRSDADAGTGFTRSALVTVEVASSLVLLVGAGLMVKSLVILQQSDPGFDDRNVLTMNVAISKRQFTAPQQETQFFSDVLTRVRALPGVQAAAAIDDLPLTGGSNQPVQAEGRPALPMSEQPEVSVRVVTPGYFRTMGIPLQQGRDLASSDGPDGEGAVVISKAMAHQFWPDGNVIGRRLKLSFFPDKERTVVGVVGDVKQNGLDTTSGIATLYWPLSQQGDSPLGKWQPRSLSLVVKTAVPPLNLAKPVKQAVADVDSGTPVDSVTPLEDLVGESLTQRRLNMQLLSIFGSLALVLCILGIYSVLAYSVKRRRREIGVRLALGASLSNVVRLVVLQAVKPTLVGMVVGLAICLALGRVAGSLVYGVSAQDGETYSVIILVLLISSVAASLLPAISATRVDPLTALREE